MRRPRLGYAMAAAAALLWGVNGAVSKTILSTGLSSERLAQVRSLGAALGLFAILAVAGPAPAAADAARAARTSSSFGVVGLAFVQWFYFLAIHRLAIGVALLIEYLAPLLVALWARFAYHEPVRRRIWAALALALVGLALIVNLFGGGASLSTAGRALRPRRRVRLRALRPARRARRRRARPGLAARLGLPLRVGVLGGARAVVDVPGRTRCTEPTSLHGHLHAVHLPGLGARGLDDRARDDRPVLPARQRPAPPARRRGSGSSRCSSRSPARSSPGSGSAETLGGVQLVGAASCSAAIVLAQTAR